MDRDWRDIPSLPNFRVNRDGDVINAKTDNIKQTSVNAQGVLKVQVTVDRVPTTRSVAVLVAEAFLTDPHPPQFNSIIHLNGDRLDCRVENLARRSRSFAIRYHRQFDARLEQQTMRGHHYYMPETGYHFETVRDVVTKYGLLGIDLLIRTLDGERVWPGGHKFELVRN